MAEAPHIEKEIWRRFKDRGVVVIGISVSDSPQRIQQYAKRRGLTYLQLMDEQQKAFKSYAKVGVIPRTILLDRDHRVVALQLGYVEKRFLKLVQTIEQMVK
ncbi:MAG: TlpA family protein disulfide reductase [Acidobacteria bacterium]|nr:MAG: TlpA family protein disulfide reductase [Acidobacteriota bacterium]